MKARLPVVATLTLFMLAGTACSVGLESDEEIASYGLGYGFATDLLMQTQGLELDLDALLAGVRAGFEGAESEVSEDRLRAAIGALGERQMAQQRQLQREQAVEARAQGAAFLAENADARWCRGDAIRPPVRDPVVDRRGPVTRPRGQGPRSLPWHPDRRRGLRQFRSAWRTCRVPSGFGHCRLDRGGAADVRGRPVQVLRSAGSGLRR
jgi:hypothetical protein